MSSEVEERAGRHVNEICYENWGVVQFDSRFGLETVGVRFIGPGKGLDQSSPYKLLPCG